MNPFTISWITPPPPPQFFKHPCEVKVSKGAWRGGTGSSVNIYLVLPPGPTRKRLAYAAVLRVEFQFITDWMSSERTLRPIIDLIPMRLGVTVTKINWWGYKRGEVLNG